MACCRTNVTPVGFFFLIVVFIFHFDLTHPAAVISDFSGARPEVWPTPGAPNTHPPKEEVSSGTGDDAAADTQPAKELCLNCEHQRSLDALRTTHGENELVQIRLEVIKEQILAKLRMTSPPNVHFPRTKLPRTLLSPHGEHMQNDHPSRSAPSADDSAGRFYSEPKQVIVFGKQGEYIRIYRLSAQLFIQN